MNSLKINVFRKGRETKPSRSWSREKNGNGEKLSRTKKTQTKNPNIRKHEQTNKNLVHSGTLAI